MLTTTSRNVMRLSRQAVEKEKAVLPMQAAWSERARARPCSNTTQIGLLALSEHVHCKTRLSVGRTKLALTDNS